MQKTYLGLTALCVALLAAIPQQAQAQAAGAALAGGTARVIVQYKADSPLLSRPALSAVGQRTVEAQRLGERLGLRLRAGANIDERTHVLFATGMTSQQLATRLARESDIEYAVPDQRRRRFTAPSDPLYLAGPAVAGSSGGPVVGQWYLHAPAGEVQSSLDVETAWNHTTGNPGIVVAVLDTGVRFDHPDLLRVAAGGNLLPGYDMISDVEVANDGDGRDADPSDPGDWLTLAEVTQSGGAFEGCDTGAEDSSWHGTQTSGLIAALTNNGIGMASVGRNVRVLPVRVLGKCGGFDSDIIAGMRWAAGLDVAGVPANPNPARVLNLSLGGDGRCNAAYRAAVAEINGAGATIVASAGNSTGHNVSTPANCSGVIAVGGLRHVGTKVGFSDLGPEITISAPAGNCVDVGPNDPCRYPILTTSNSGLTAPIADAAGGSIYTDSFNASLGTSFSAPLVAGSVALMLSVQPALAPIDVRTLLQASARPFPTTGGNNGDGTEVPQCTAPQPIGVTQIDQLQCYCTTATCGAGMLDAGAAVRAAIFPPGSANIVTNPYGAVGTQGATLNGNTISNLQSNAVIQLGGTPGTPGSFAEIDFQGFNLGAGKTLTLRSGAPGQSVLLYNADATASSIAGILSAEGGNGAAAPSLYLHNPNGITVLPGGNVIALAGLTVETLGNIWTTGQSLVNNGVIDGGGSLSLYGARINGGGAFKGNAVAIATYGNANNPANGAHFLANGLQLYPSSGTEVALTLDAYGISPQVLNLMANGNATVAMPSAWPAGTSRPPNNLPVLPGGTRAPGTPDPGFGAGSMIVQASGTLTLVGSGSNDFVFPGGIVLKSGGTLDLNGVVIDNGWTTTGKSFQGVFFESTNIVSNAGNIQVLTNNLNWINFSTLPHAPVRTWQLVQAANGGAQYVTADTVAPHLNTYSILIETAATGGCWACVVNTNPVNMQ